MKRITLAVALLFVPYAMNAQTGTNDNLRQRLQLLEDRAALKALVDTFSILADRKDVQKQVLLFTEDATVESYSGTQLTSSLKGRKQIGDTFGPFLAGFETVFHMNGQQAVDIHGDTASGVSYCLVVLIGKQNGRTIRTTFGIYYVDDYVRRGGTWLIAKRISHFTWQDRQEVTPASP